MKNIIESALGITAGIICIFWREFLSITAAIIVAGAVCLFCCCGEKPNGPDSPEYRSGSMTLSPGDAVDLLGAMFADNGDIYGVPNHDLEFNTDGSRHTFTAPGYQSASSSAGGIQAGTGSIAPATGYGGHVQFESNRALVWLLCRDNLHYCRIELIEVSGELAFIEYRLNLDPNDLEF